MSYEKDHAVLDFYEGNLSKTFKSSWSLPQESIDKIKAHRRFPNIGQDLTRFRRLFKLGYEASDNHSTEDNPFWEKKASSPL